MSSDPRPTLHRDTRIVHDDIAVPEGFASLSRPTHRASTILSPNAEAFSRRREDFFHGYWYGLSGTPTHYALMGRLAELEGASHCVLAPSGLGAINLVNQAFLRAGDHVLVTDSAYGPTRSNLVALMGRYGIEAEFYDPGIGAGIAALLRPATRLVWLESPGSLTMEVQDLPAIAGAAHAHGALVAIDNTWATPVHCAALALGADFSVQALTKYIGGHADLLMGSVCVRDVALYEQLKLSADWLGNNVSPDDCSQVLKGLLTLGVRLERHERNALRVAQWLQQQPAVAEVLYPALPGSAGHALWQRDFTGSSGLLSIVLRTESWAQTCAFVDRLQCFAIGASWGGPQSLVGVYRNAGERAVPGRHAARPLVRLSIGLESADDLIDDLARALSVLAP